MSRRCEVTVTNELGPSELARWEELRALSPSLESPFLSAAFTAHVGAVRPDARVAVLDGGAGFLPFHTGPTRLGRPIGRKLANAQGPVTDPSLDWDPRDVVRRCGLRALTFENLVHPQPALDPYVTDTGPSPQIRLDDGFDAYLQTARREGRGGPKGAARQQRRLDKEHEVRFVFDERDPALLRTLLSWKSRQYRETGAFDQMSRPWVVELLERLHASQDPSCAGILSALYVDDELVALDFALRSGGHMSSWFPAYVPEWSNFSPGSVLLLHTLRAAAEDGVTTLDLGKGSESYKDRWATASTPLSSAVVTTGGLTAGLTATGRVAWGLGRRTRLRGYAERLRWRLDVG